MASRDQNWRQQLSTRVAFLIAGIGFSTLAPLVPTLKARFMLTEDHLGLLLFCLGFGSLAVMPFGGSLVSKFGCRKVIIISAIGLLVSLPALVLSPNPGCLAAALCLMGAGGGTLDVVMNIQAVIVEKESGRPMMSGFHGLFSVGGIVGAGSVTGLLSLGVEPSVCQLMISALGLAMIVGVASSLMAQGPERSSESRRAPWPKGIVILIGVLCLTVFAAEGAVADWGGVLLTKYRGVRQAHGGLGYVAFAAMMTTNRLLGDRVVARMGSRVVALGGGLIAAIGYLLAAFLPWWYASVIGFGFVGFGLANVVPILFSATGKQTTMPPNLALSSVSTMGYVGLLVAPPILGFLARASSLIVSMTLLAFLCLGVALCSLRITQLDASSLPVKRQS